MANTSVYVTPTQPSLKGAQIPNGHVSLNSKFHGTDIEKAITGSGLRALFDDSIGLIDCYPSCNCAVVIAQECHLVNEIEMKQKIKKLSKFPRHKIILVEVTDTSQQYFQEMQKQMSLNEMKIKLIPCSCPKDVGLIIKQLACLDNQTNQFELKNKANSPYEESIINFLLSFPGIGEKKALELLKAYPSIKEIASATVPEISKIVGQATAEAINKTLASKV